MFAIETKNLTKKYLPPKGIRSLLIKSPLKKAITAVDKANLQIRKGEIFGLLGQNGAGKTTLIKMLTTLLWPTSGKAIVNGFDVIKEADEARNSVGLVTGEERSFYWRLTGRQNLQFFASLYGIKQSDANKRIDLLLKQLDLYESGNNMFYSYSSGMKQKLSMARGLLCNPEVLFLDEPTKSMDVITGQALHKYIKKTLVEEENRTVFLTTHHLEEAESLCNRVAIVNNGRILFCGEISKLRRVVYKKETFNLYVKGIEKSSMRQICEHPALTDLSIKPFNGNSTLKIGFSVSNGDNPISYIVKNVLEKNGALISVNKVEPKLEDLYTHFLKGASNVAQ